MMEPPPKEWKKHSHEYRILANVAKPTLGAEHDMRGFLVAVVLSLAVTVCGCGGKRTQAIATGANGSLEGMRTIPQDGSFGVPTDVWIRLYWPTGYEPPPEFTFRLLTDAGSRVRTYAHKGEEQYEWWFEPVYELSDGAKYKIVVESNDERVTVYFWTREYHRVKSPSMPRSTRISPPLEEHVIRTVR